MKIKLTGRTILITGGTSGIGLQLAKDLLQRGNRVIITGRDAVRLKDALQKLPGLDGFQGDVSKVDDIVAMHSAIAEKYPALDVLINNAGIMRKLVLSEPRDGRDVIREVDINLSGPIRMIQQFLPQLLKQPQAVIVNVSSGLAFVPFPLSPIYSATKAGLHAYTLALRMQLLKTSVAVIELAPPGVDTPLFPGEFAAEMKGQKGMNVAVLSRKALAGIEAGRLEIRPGLSNVLKLMSRLAPGLMLRQMPNVK